MGGHSQVAVYPPFIDSFPALSFLIRPAFTGGSGPALMEFAPFCPAGLAGAPCTLERVVNLTGNQFPNMWDGLAGRLIKGRCPASNRNLRSGLPCGCLHLQRSAN